MLYKNSLDGVTESMLVGFFVDWPNPPSPATHLKLLKNSSYIVIAIDEDTNRVVGFITAISDEVLSAYIPLLEVLPEYKNQGIGKELVGKMLKQLEHLYMIDLCCDDDLIPYYENFGMMKGTGMIHRNYDRQAGN
jgi:ribosomal protein S18 acetylase RimI-like enzyme